VGAIVIVALLVLGAVYYVAVYNKPSGPSGYFAVQVAVGIAGHLQGTNATYLPQNFTVEKGEHVSLVIMNADNVTHGLAIQQFNLDTGQIKPNGTATLSFVPTAVGTIIFDEPSPDCGGGNCDAGQQMNGNITVIA
jgi:heme/copper-type cytochrome/quinol oxidase subunit 2